MKGRIYLPIGIVQATLRLKERTEVPMQVFSVIINF